MEKNFDDWNVSKKMIQNERENRYYNKREIWWCNLGVNIGSEQDGTGEEFQRPVLIICGINKNTCVIIPLTTSKRRHYFRIPIGLVDGKETSAIISQIRLIDTKRLINKLGFLNQDVFECVRKAVKAML